MQTKKENWFTLKLLLLMNVILISAIFFLHAATAKTPAKKQEPCSSSKKINADIINSVTVKLM